MICGVNNTNEYIASTNVDGYPSCNTCWDCKNKHKSTITQQMARKQKFAKVLLDSTVFLSLQEKRTLHHQPVTKITDVETRVSLLMG
jgi:Zn-dependent alcohol dehydrogenase